MNTKATIRAFAALRLPLQDVSWYSCDDAVYRIPSPLPEAVQDWLARHPEAGNPAPASRVGKRLTTAALEKWRVLYAPSVRTVLAAPAKHKLAAKRAYRAQLA